LPERRCTRVAPPLVPPFGEPMYQSQLLLFLLLWWLPNTLLDMQDSLERCLTITVDHSHRTALSPLVSYLPPPPLLFCTSWCFHPCRTGAPWSKQAPDPLHVTDYLLKCHHQPCQDTPCVHTHTLSTQFYRRASCTGPAARVLSRLGRTLPAGRLVWRNAGRSR
jgi:hypothetical protein